MDESIVHNMANGDLAIWLDQSGSICVKSVDKYGDPVELSEHEALELAKLLVRLAENSRHQALL